MSVSARSALRVAFLTMMILSASAVAQSYVQSTGAAETEQSAPTATPISSTSASATPAPTTATEAVADTDAGRTGTGSPASTDSRDATATTQPSRDTVTPTRTPVSASSSQTRIDVESRFDEATSQTLPAERWSTQRVRAASGHRGLTVVATQGFYKSGQTAELAAFTPNGTVVHFNDTYRVYFDVDPVEGERYTVEYLAARHHDGASCAQFDGNRCTNNVVNRVNLTTGEHETIYAEMTPRVASARWHDADRYNDTHLVLADIVDDSVSLVDTRDGSKSWRWDADENYSREQGGSWADWTHLNDVEILPDGRVMASPRNMDEVVFLDARNGDLVMDDNWTLGADENHSTLYEQHNPDYVPWTHGGPAVLVADSENQRVLEYQRVDDEWVRTWSWRDVRLTWPRDVDRLPNGNTLIVDSNGNRVVELDADDDIVWSAELGMPYDVERIGTGDESTGGMAARLRDEAPIQSRTPVPSDSTDTAENDSGDLDRDRSSANGSNVDITAETTERTTVDRFWFGVKDALPSMALNSALYVAPPWVLFTDLIFAVVFVFVGLCWGASEFYWSRVTLCEVVSNLGGRLQTGVERVR